jgi:RNA polymerase sigma-70 factor (sigma-E family)
VRDEPLAVEELERFLAERGERLLRTAILLAGGREAGEDLLQSALERVYRNRHAIDGDPEPYLRRTLTHLAVDGWRRHARWLPRLGLLWAGDSGQQPDGTACVDQRDELVRLLMRLPARQRAAIVLRYWEDLTEAETARVMGCSVGTVKAATSRGLGRLRELSGTSAGSPPITTRGQS